MAMETVVEPHDRYNLRKTLTIMERDLRALEKKDVHILDQSMLECYKIRALPLSLDADDSLAPKFFASFAVKDMPEPTPEYVEREYDTSRLTLITEPARVVYHYLKSYVGSLMVDFPEIRQKWTSHQVGDYNFGSNRLYRMSEPQFGTFWILHDPKAAKPHIKCVMYNEIYVDDNHLLCGEVLTVMLIMLGQLKQRVFVNDMVAPVLLFSLNLLRPRVIEAYFDGQELVIRYTKSYDFKLLNEAGFKTFAQWLLGDAIGDTSREAIRTV
ncbi:hypothetical protein ASPZODRAFT_131632 [Penicilliopsis zonata CBS 506.65]|uniref:Uncharacterized protein n=1 Tax=Penicilliopsis zonata CBS 506.65 TaxID=1073090 RepID=A0A1L9SLD8_9EURO|nr:hypothetical protein ASPZODRAFT_131632 [Penicilliopsis zonata CBS 506.65]OJJ47990.1 hypothetical protein ASPZODRAFT_131632 [Penicilliopsis zonata CBS 506.65]